MENVRQDIKIAQRSVSLQTLIQFGMNPSKNHLIQAGVFLHRELRVRLAHRINDLDHMPYGLNEMPAVLKGKEWYMVSYNELCESPKPETEELEM
jgi:pyruvate dehydrogenase kinase 2/3/4